MILEIRTDSKVPIYQQIYNQLLIGIAQKQLLPGETLPSVRQMADEIGVNMMTVSKAYTLLKSDGYILTDRRSGTKVVGKQPLNAVFREEFSQELNLLLAKAYIHQVSEEDVRKKIVAFYKKFN